MEIQWITFFVDFLMKNLWISEIKKRDAHSTLLHFSVGLLAFFLFFYKMSLPVNSLYSLTWGDYGTSLVSAVQLLRCHGDLVDVTLAAGGRSFQAHKIVLCAASPYLLELLKVSKPFLILIFQWNLRNFPQFCERPIARVIKWDNFYGVTAPTIKREIMKNTKNTSVYLSIFFFFVIKDGRVSAQ